MPSGDKDVPQGKGEMKRTKESAAQYELELKRMIENLRNYGCIIAWVPFNEGWGQFDTKRIAELVKKLDPTRLVNSASGWNDMKVGDVHDIHVYPGPASPKPEKEPRRRAGRVRRPGAEDRQARLDRKDVGVSGSERQGRPHRRYEKLMQKVYQLKEKPGLSAVVYTQTTDVEAEANGLMTYDRAVIKADIERVAAANKGDFSRVPTYRVVVPTSEAQGQEWPLHPGPADKGWMKSDFDDKDWTRARAASALRGRLGPWCGRNGRRGDLVTPRVHVAGQDP